MFRIDDCAISARRAKALQKLVEEFHWDGKEVIFDEHEDVDDSTLTSDFSSHFTLNSPGWDSDSDAPGSILATRLGNSGKKFRRIHVR
ncbi:hypothetical protein BJV77DRAFT_518079 [Russula vinacea]|nr:hypothetical protein BJV77DRAFT_518079 [Russula vinacea]